MDAGQAEQTQSPDELKQAASDGDVRAQYQLGKYYLSQDNVSRGRRWLSRAADNGFGPAARDMGLMHAQGDVMPLSPPDGIAWLKCAAQLNDPEALSWLAQFEFSGFGAPADLDAARSHLLQAARADEPVALRQLAYVYGHISDDADWQTRAFGCFERAASRGDAWAAYACGMRLLRGIGTDQNEAAARAWLAQSHEGGIYLAAQYADETKHTEKPPAREFEPSLLVDFEWPAPKQGDLKRLSETPPVYRFSRLITPEMCEYLINRAHPYLEPAKTVNPKTGQSFHSNLRTNSNMGFVGQLLDIPIHLAERDMMHLAQADVRRAERLALLRYGPGQEYRPHFDYINPHAKDSIYEYRERGQRVRTIFAYLNDVGSGGETEFPRLNLKIEPEAGGGVMFDNVTPDGKAYEETLHAGCPVGEGEKWLATLWIREHPVTYR